MVHVAAEHSHQQHVEADGLCYAGELWSCQYSDVTVDPAIDQIGTKQTKQRTYNSHTQQNIV